MPRVSHSPASPSSSSSSPSASSSTRGSADPLLRQDQLGEAEVRKLVISPKKYVLYSGLNCFPSRTTTTMCPPPPACPSPAAGRRSWRSASQEVKGFFLFFNLFKLLKETDDCTIYIFRRLCRLGNALLRAAPVLPGGGGEKGGDSGSGRGTQHIFPQKCTKKNIIALILKYGFVFGIAHMAAMLAAPVFAVFAGRIGPKKVYLTGRKAFFERETTRASHKIK